MNFSIIGAPNIGSYIDVDPFYKTNPICANYSLTGGQLTSRRMPPSGEAPQTPRCSTNSRRLDRIGAGQRCGSGVRRYSMNGMLTASVKPFTSSKKPRKLRNPLPQSSELFFRTMDAEASTTPICRKASA